MCVEIDFLVECYVKPFYAYVLNAVPREFLANPMNLGNWFFEHRDVAAESLPF